MFAWQILMLANNKGSSAKKWDEFAKTWHFAELASQWSKCLYDVNDDLVDELFEINQSENGWLCYFYAKSLRKC